MQFFLRLCLFLLLNCVIGRAELNTHKCLAGSETFVCTLPSFHYNPEDNIPTFSLPEGVNAIRFVRPFYTTSFLDRTIGVYDVLLHIQLNSPKAIEIINNRLTRIEIPPNLEYGDFKENPIKKIYVLSNQSYALRYLNLNANYRLGYTIPTNISMFVNLETLYMSNCNIMIVPEGIFDNMNRLKHLNLADNYIKLFDLSKFPQSLTKLIVEDNRIDSLNFPSDRFPQLKELNVEDNRIKNVDISALLAMAPKLKLIALGHNPIKRAQLITIMDELDRRNVAYYNLELPKDSECLANERKFRGACIPESSFPFEAGDWVEIVLLVGLLIVILVGVVFGGVKLWTKYHPSWEVVNYFNRQSQETT